MQSTNWADRVLQPSWLSPLSKKPKRCRPTTWGIVDLLPLRPSAHMHRPGYYPYRVVVGPPFKLTYKASPRKEYFLGLVFNTGLLLALGDNEEPAAFKLSSEYIFHQYDGPRSRGSAFSASGYKSAQPESTSGRLSNVDPPLFNFPLSFPVILNACSGKSGSPPRHLDEKVWQIHR